MAKVCMIERNVKRKKLNEKTAKRRAKLKATVMKRDLPIEERFAAQMQLSQLPRNAAKNRYRNRCEVTGRSRGFYRKFKLCRNQLRELGSFGLIPGLVKASW
jgi:small subunit ribosomal protein S14